jgi:predicted RNA binding protein YcfA (HicA-like mRNA interferase family)
MRIRAHLWDSVMPVSSREVIRMLERDGWQHVRTRGDHLQFKHPTKPGLVTVQARRKDIPDGTLGKIERQSGLTLNPKKRGQ